MMMIQLLAPVMLIACISSSGIIAVEVQGEYGAMTGSAAVDGSDLKLFTSPGAIQESRRIRRRRRKNELVKATLATSDDVSSSNDDEISDDVVVHNPDSTPFKEPGETEVTGVEELVGGRRQLRRNLNVFLPDTRENTNNREYPARVVGSFNGCTCTLVAYANIAVTNAHCLDYKRNGMLDPDTFKRVLYLGLEDGNYVRATTPQRIAYSVGLDYAVLLLKDDFSPQIGRYGVRFEGADYFKRTDRRLGVIAYSGDHCPSFRRCVSKVSFGSSKGTTMLRRFDGRGSTETVRHDLDVMRGSSGSLMFESPVNGCCPIMIALNHAEFRDGENSMTRRSYSNGYANLARPSSDWKAGYDLLMNGSG